MYTSTPFGCKALNDKHDQSIAKSIIYLDIVLDINMLVYVRLIEREERKI